MFGRHFGGIASWLQNMTWHNLLTSKRYCLWSCGKVLYLEIPNLDFTHAYRIPCKVSPIFSPLPEPILLMEEILHLACTKPLYIMGCLPYQLVIAGFLPSTIALLYGNFPSYLHQPAVFGAQGIKLMTKFIALLGGSPDSYKAWCVLSCIFSPSVIRMSC